MPRLSLPPFSVVHPLRHESTPPAPAPGSAPRYLLYSHDSYGLGHLRRNLTVAGALVESHPGASVLIVTGSPAATFFDMPPGVELVKLPSVTKDEHGAYTSRNLPGPVEATLELRSRLLFETYRTYRPDAVVVDHQVVGLRGEMLPVLRAARADGVRTVLGVRDVIDSPEAVAREWGTDEARWALAEGYDRVCVYGDPLVFDPRIEYPLPPELGASLEFVGYVVRAFPRHSRRPVPSMRPQVLVTVGGGEDGAERLDCVLSALGEGPNEHDTVVVGGPLLDAREARRLKRSARELDGVEVHRFHADLPRLLAESELVVCMAGYNTCAEVLHSGRRAVFLPRTFPRREQAIRASRLAALGLGTSLEAPTPATLRAAIAAELRRGQDTQPTARPRMDGAARLARVVESLATERASASRRKRAEAHGEGPGGRTFPFRVSPSSGAVRPRPTDADGARAALG